MKLVKKFFLLTFFYLSSAFAQENEEFIVNLKNPTFSGGVLKTTDGGVITAPGLRIQAQRIEYTNKLENGILVQRVVAEEDLMMEYQGRTFVGKKLEFDLLTKTGCVWEGKTFVEIWFLGGEKIELKEDGSYVIYNGYITTCECQDNTWEIRVDCTHITKGYLLSAKDIRFRFIKIPIFWLPAFKSNLKFLRDPPIRYKVVWDKGIGPRVSLRYRIYSWEQFNVFLRFDYRIKLGPGAALETDFHSKDGRTIFQTKNYGAYDKSFPNEKGNDRFRFQGLFHTSSEDQNTQFHVQWDRMSDDRMVSDFKNEDFEINTQKRNYLNFLHQQNNTFGSLHFEPKLNHFQSMNQELPYTVVGLRSFEIWRTGIISENRISGSYFDYTYANELDRLLKNRRSGRLETKNQVYRPIHTDFLTLTPNIGIVGIFYSNSPDHDAIGQLVLTYGVNGESRFSRQYGKHKHLMAPYFNYQGLSRPQAGVDRHFIFDIEDGYARLDQVRIGVRNNVYTQGRPVFLPSFESDLYTYAFFGARSFHQVFPKIFAKFAIHQETFLLQFELVWNFQQQLLDRGNVQLLWTVTDSFALGMEYRHRSKFDWRKAEKENFVMDFARKQSELLESPLSDRRSMFITKAHLRFSPRWNMHLESRHAWNRKGEPSFNQLLIDLYTMLTCSYQLKLSFQLTPNDWQIVPHLNLIK